MLGDQRAVDPDIGPVIDRTEMKHDAASAIGRLDPNLAAIPDDTMRRAASDAARLRLRGNGTVMTRSNISARSTQFSRSPTSASSKAKCQRPPRSIQRSRVICGRGWSGSTFTIARLPDRPTRAVRSRARGLRSDRGRAGRQRSKPFQNRDSDQCRTVDRMRRTSLPDLDHAGNSRTPERVGTIPQR